MAKRGMRAELDRRASLYVASVLTGLDQLSESELNRLARCCRRLTSTNCWWAEYRIGPQLLKEIKCEQNRRRRNRCDLKREARRIVATGATT